MWSTLNALLTLAKFYPGVQPALVDGVLGTRAAPLRPIAPCLLPMCRPRQVKLLETCSVLL